MSQLEKNYYFVDLTHTPLDVSYDEKAVVKKHMRELGLKKLSDLNTYDLKAFETLDAAEEYLRKYKEVLKSLDNKKICKSRKLPAMLYKRRYIVQTLLGEKNQTYRHYLKSWKKNDLINLHDQTYFLTVKIKEIIKHAENKYEYKFELP